MARPKIRLDAVRIDSFRSCERTSFSPRADLSVLIGPNGSGKTNLLQGIALLSSGLSRARAYREQSVERAASSAQISAGFRLGAAQLSLRSTVRYTLNDVNQEEIVGLKDEWRAGGLDDARARAWVELPFEIFLPQRDLAGQLSSYPRHFDPTNGMPLTRRIIEFVSAHQKMGEQIVAFRRRTHYYSASQFTDPAQCPSAIEIDQDDRLVGSGRERRGHAQFLLDLFQLKETNPSQYAAYVSLVGKQGLQLISSLHWKRVKIASSQVDVRMGGKVAKRKRERVLLIPSVTRDSDRLSLSQLSEGTLRTMALVFYLLADGSDLLLIEEPEACVHHGLLVSVVELIKSASRDKQIMISTHSDFVLDHVEPENVFSVTRGARGKTSARSLAEGYSPEKLAALHEFLRTDGNLGDYWRQGGLDS